MTVSVLKMHRTKEFILGGDLSLVNDTVKVAILEPGFVYTTSLVQFSQVSGLEIAQTLHYPSGGIEAIGKVVGTLTNGKSTFSTSDMSFPNIDDTIRTIVMYVETTAYGIVNPLICVGDLGADLLFKNSELMLTWPTPIITW